jgi:hypothetical protein
LANGLLALLVFVVPIVLLAVGLGALNR